jgi:hypothetical protein
VQENYYALIVAICSKKFVTIEQAFSILNTGKKVHVDDWQKKQIVEEMIALREKGLTYQQIGDIYGIGKDDVFKRIQRARTKCTA